MKTGFNQHLLDLNEEKDDSDYVYEDEDRTSYESKIHKVTNVLDRIMTNYDQTKTGDSVLITEEHGIKYFSLKHDAGLQLPLPLCCEVDSCRKRGFHHVFQSLADSR